MSELSDYLQAKRSRSKAKTKEQSVLMKEVQPAAIKQTGIERTIKAYNRSAEKET